MAKPGDVVEFRSGLWGIEAPRNIGILADRWRHKGVPWVRLVTLEGVKEAKAEHLSRRAFRQRFDGDLRRIEDATARLRQLVALHTSGSLAEEAEDDLGRLEEALWEATSHEPGPWTEEAIASAHFGEPSPQQLRDTRAALARCRRPGVGRFEAQSKGDLWRPWTQDEREAMRSAWDDLKRLRAKLVEVQETEEGRIFARVPLEEAGLEDADRATLTWVRDAMAQFVEHDGTPEQGVAGIGGLGAAAAFGMDLHRELGFLAADWIPDEPTDRGSDYVHFLLATGLWTPDQSVAALTRRHVNKEPFFEHTEDPEAEAAADALLEPDLADDPARTDLRHLTCWTIDPPDAKDFDDAVGLEPTPDGDRLWVHIADVSHYVRPDTRLDRHARRRATSVYLPGRVLPMLPHRIADHLCSLRDDGDRFALSVAMDVDAEGRVAAATFHRSMIRVTKNMSYGDALARRDAGDEAMHALFALAARMRSQRRGLAIETGELRVLLEDTGFTSTEKRGDDATRMIEVFMVAANEAVARHLAEQDAPALYRCHPLPDPAKAERFSHQAEAMGFGIPMDLPRQEGTSEERMTSLLDHLKAGGGKLQLFGGGVGLAGQKGEPDDADEEPDPDEAQSDAGFAGLSPEDQEKWLRPVRHATEVLAACKDRGLADIATGKLLSCMGQAWYTATNVGHYGLGLTHYLHFTSPIRRYPDLVVHRNLAWLIAQGHTTWTAGGSSGSHAPVDPLQAPHPADTIANMADHCSDQERAAAGLERRVRDACLVLAARPGPSHARITTILPRAVFVVRDDGIDAMVPARELPGGPYHVDEWESMLLVDARDAVERFGEQALERIVQETGQEDVVRARLGDHVQASLARRAVVEGRAEARIQSWGA